MRTTASSLNPTVLQSYAQCMTSYRTVGPHHNASVSYIPCSKATQLMAAQTKNSFVYNASISVLNYKQDIFFQSFDVLTAPQFSSLLKCITTQDNHVACVTDSIYKTTHVKSV